MAKCANLSTDWQLRSPSWQTVRALHSCKKAQRLAGPVYYAGRNLQIWRLATLAIRM
jgi:hypothetical protein